MNDNRPWKVRYDEARRRGKVAGFIEAERAKAGLPQRGEKQEIVIENGIEKLGKS